MKRVLVIGSGGSGKTTLAKAIAEKTSLPLIHLDQLFWHPGWISTPDPEWDQITDELIMRDAWVMDGNYGRTLPKRLEAADTIVFLDLPRVVCTWRILKRRLRHLAGSRPDVAPGCPEQVNWEFLMWVWTYPSRRRPGILRQLAALKQRTRVYVLRSSKDVGDFMKSI